MVRLDGAGFSWLRGIFTVGSFPWKQFSCGDISQNRLGYRKVRIHQKGSVFCAICSAEIGPAYVSTDARFSSAWQGEKRRNWFGRNGAGSSSLRQGRTCYAGPTIPPRPSLPPRRGKGARGKAGCRPSCVTKITLINHYTLQYKKLHTQLSYIH